MLPIVFVFLGQPGHISRDCTEAGSGGGSSGGGGYGGRSGGGGGYGGGGDRSCYNCGMFFGCSSGLLNFCFSLTIVFPEFLMMWIFCIVGVAGHMSRECTQERKSGGGGGGGGGGGDRSCYKVCE